MRWLSVLLMANALAFGQTLAEKMDAVLQASAAAQQSFWGIQVVNLTTGKTLFESGQNRLFVPASTAKLFSTALALQRLGPDHRFVTLVMADHDPDAAGRISGDLRIVGGGDPTLSGRPFPYKSKSLFGDPLQPIEELADQVMARGLRRIDGSVVGDDTAYPWEPYPEGRAQEDAIRDYGAPVSALTVNENRLVLTIRPGRRAGDPATLRLSPPLEYFVIDNRVRTTAAGEGRVEVERMPGSRQLRVWGVLPVKGGATSRLLAIEDPAEFAAMALHDALTRRGVTISGKPVARHRFANELASLKGAPAPPTMPKGVEMARRLSPPLIEILEVVNKESQNLFAELVLREVGRVRRNLGSRQAGIEELLAFAREAGIADGECSLVDGSGLSTLDLVTPRAMTRLLAFMQASPHREAWMNLLPVGGTDGTLSRRFAASPAAGRILAKTGTMSHVSALAGYATSINGDTLAFLHSGEQLHRPGRRDPGHH